MVRQADMATMMRQLRYMKPWKSAGVSLRDWRRARRAVVGLIADLAWRARGSKETRPMERDAAIERLSRIAAGDPESTRYGLDLAQGDERAAND
jgi:hypothetical protein